MKAALILLGFFLCASVERISFRKFRFVFRLGVFLVFILLALLCAGCTQEKINEISDGADQRRREANARGAEEVKAYRDSETGCEYVGIQGRSLTPRMALDGKQICRQVAP